MQIEIKLLTQFKQYLPDPDVDGNVRSIKVNDSGKIGDVFKELGIPLNIPKTVSQNASERDEAGLTDFLYPKAYRSTRCRRCPDAC